MTYLILGIILYILISIAVGFIAGFYNGKRENILFYTYKNLLYSPLLFILLYLKGKIE